MSSASKLSGMFPVRAVKFLGEVQVGQSGQLLPLALVLGVVVGTVTRHGNWLMVFSD